MPDSVVAPGAQTATSTVPPTGTAAQNTEPASQGAPGQQGAPAGNSAEKTQTVPPATTSEMDESKWDDKTKAYIGKLRKEAADRRTTAKALEEQLTANNEQLGTIKKALGLEDEASPEDQISMLTNDLQSAQTNAELYRLSLENGIPMDGVEYFSYLVEKAAGGLEEGQELTEEALGAIIAEAKKRAGGSVGATSVQGQGAAQGQGTPPAGNSGDITADQFAKMNISEKSALYGKQPDLYNSLMKQAIDKNLLL